MAAALGVLGCADDGSGTGGSGGGETSSGGAGGQGSPRQTIGAAQVLVINPTDATVTLSNAYEIDEVTFSLTIAPRDGEWVEFPVYEGGCFLADTCVTFEVEGVPDLSQPFLDAKDGDELVFMIESNGLGLTFPASEVGEPSPGHAALFYLGDPTGFGYVDGDELVPLFDRDEVPAGTPVAYADGEAGYTLVAEGGHPFIDGSRYVVDGRTSRRSQPPSLLVCDLSYEAPALGCFDYLLAE